MADIKNRIQDLRQAIRRLGANAFYCTLSDAHLSEYIQEADQFLTYLTGFTGSNAQVLITEHEAYLWTDSRYWEQASKELEGSDIVLMRQGEEGVPEVYQWLAEHNATTPFILAAPLETLSLVTFNSLAQSASRIMDFDDALINQLWSLRPSRAVRHLYVHKASSVSAKDKLLRLKAYLSTKGEGQGALLLTRLDDIAWLTNLRGSDIAFNPVFLSWALISQEKAHLFVHQKVLNSDIVSELMSSGWTICDYSELHEKLKELISQNTSILARETDLNAKLFTEIKDTFKDFKHPVALWKSIKTKEEIEGLKEVMKADGQALQDFIDEVKVRLARGEKLTENDAVDILHQKRSAIEGFIGESFGQSLRLTPTLHCLTMNLKRVKVRLFKRLVFCSWTPVLTMIKALQIQRGFGF